MCTLGNDLFSIVANQTPGKFYKHTISNAIDSLNSEKSCMQIFIDKNPVDVSKNALMAPPYARHLHHFYLKIE